VPTDLVGTRIYNQKTGEFGTTLGPVFANLLLADEINRAPAKVQSALLEVMQERQVTIAGETHKVPLPFVVMATQNPIETEGTYPLPEAQLDRFMMKVLVDYPSDEEEYVIAEPAVRAIAELSLPIDLIAVIPATENMPSGTAIKPGDIITQHNGVTVEVNNTDAEGRLILADALSYAVELGAERIVDLATLTGAIIIALGNEHAGLFSNDDKLSEQLIAAGNAVGETVWRMPLGPEYDKLIDCDVADMKNISGGRAGGSITAAQFLQRFIQNGTPWAHLDIAGVAWSTKDKPTVPKGGTGYGVRLLDAFVAEHYEK